MHSVMPAPPDTPFLNADIQLVHAYPVRPEWIGHGPSEEPHTLARLALALDDLRLTLLHQSIYTSTQQRRRHAVKVCPSAPLPHTASWFPPAPCRCVASLPLQAVADDGTPTSSLRQFSLRDLPERQDTPSHPVAHHPIIHLHAPLVRLLPIDQVRVALLRRIRCRPACRQLIPERVDREAYLPSPLLRGRS